MVLTYKNFGKPGFERDITIGDVKVLGVAGPSGVGKSTLLRSVAFLEPEVMGECWLGDEPLWRDGAAVSDKFPSIKAAMGFIFQDLYLWDHLSVLRNVSLALNVQKKMSPADAEQKSMDLLSQFGLDAYRDRKPTEISGGEAQRLAWARALALGPEVIFMDEPSSSLDSRTRDECLRFVLGAYPQLKLVLVSHDQAWLSETCTQILRL